MLFTVFIMYAVTSWHVAAAMVRWPMNLILVT